jgi:thiamine pyrophosphate-dependent acetolactate synthase large subunit-like protein
MGLAAPIGLGLALARPDRRVVVFDGDGNLLMSLGVLANVATLAPAGFVHVVFDNGVYGSTGNQRSPAARLRLDRLAAAAGYRTALAVTEAPAVVTAVRRALTTPGPHFVLVKVTTEQPPVGRIPHAPQALRDRFRAAVLAP